MVDSGKLFGKMVWLFVGGGNGDVEINVFGCCCYGWYYGERFVYWLLSVVDDSRV